MNQAVLRGGQGGARRVAPHDGVDKRDVLAAGAGTRAAFGSRHESD